MTERFYHARGANEHRGLVNKEDANHFEPNEGLTCLPYCNPELPQFTAAWFKVYLSKTPQADGIDYYDMLFGKEKDSLCGGGDGAMKECEMRP